MAKDNSLHGALGKMGPNLKRAKITGSNGGGRQTRGSSDESEPLVAVAHSASYKDALLRQGVGGISKTATMSAPVNSGVSRMAPEIYSPLYQFANLNLPRDRVTMNAWNRAFYQTNPYVKNSLTLHSTYPISKINIKCKDPKIEQFFQNMSEDINLEGVVNDLASEYWVNGEAFPYAEFDEDRKVWSRIVVQNPDYIVVKRAIIASEPIVFLKPDDTLMRIATSSNPVDAALKAQIPDHMLHYVRKGQPIPLNNFNISHIKMTAAPYDIRGTSIMVSIYKDLMLYDKLRESKFAQADSMVNPITLVKIGGNTEGEYRPSPQDLQFWKNIFEEAQYDKDFKIFTHQGVDVQRVGYSGAVLDIQGDLEFITKNIMVGLMIPPALLDQEWASYSSATVGLEILRDRYDYFRNELKRWLERKIFAPISKAQGFYEIKEGKKKLIVPEIEWNKMNLYDLDSYTNVLVQLNQSQPAKVSRHSLYRSLGLNYDEEEIKMRQEMIDDVRRAKEMQVLQQKSLAELRSLNAEEPILEEPEQTNLPGQIPGAPGGDMGLGGDMGMGGMGMGGGGMGGLGGGMGDLGGAGLGGGMGDLGGAGLGGAPGGGMGAPAGGAPAVAETEQDSKIVKESDIKTNNNVQADKEDI